MTKEQVITRVKHSSMYIDDRETADYIIKALEQQPSDDCVSRKAVKEGMIKYGFRAPDMTVTEFIEDELPPVTPTHGTCKDCKYCFVREGNDPNATMCEIQGCAYVDSDFYCKYFDKRGNENG